MIRLQIKKYNIILTEKLQVSIFLLDKIHKYGCLVGEKILLSNKKKNDRTS